MSQSLKVVRDKCLFSLIQYNYDLTHRKSGKKILQMLLIKAFSANRLRQQFSDNLDLFNVLSLEADGTFTPNYSFLSVVDDFVDHINLTVDEKNQASGKKTESSTLTPQQCPVIVLKLELRSDPIKWVSFINLFNYTIHNNVYLNSVTKCQYLLSILSNEPLDLIKSLTISDANYHIERKISFTTLDITSLLNTILGLPTINHSSKQMGNFITIHSENTEA